MIQAVRGTYDLLPGDVEIWHAVEAQLLEHTELFVRGVGEETDVVSKEMYTFADRDETTSLATKEQRNIKEDEIL